MDIKLMQPMAGSYLDAAGYRAEGQQELQTRRHVGLQLDQAAETIPMPDSWAVVGTGAAARLLILADAALFTLSRETPPDWDPQMVVRCHPVEITEVCHWRDDRRTYWRFTFKRVRENLEVRGTFNYAAQAGADETFDQAETFARALASKVG